jgi:hypothetical protein
MACKLKLISNLIVVAMVRGCLKVLPHPNPPLIKGRELDFLLSPLYKGELRGVM